MTFDRAQLRRVTALRDLTEEETRRYTEEQDRRQKEVDSELSRIEKDRAAAARRAKEAAAKAEKEKEKDKGKDDQNLTPAEKEKKDKDDKKSLEEGLALVKKFPPKDGWGEERYQWLQIKFPTVGAALTDDEKEFVDGYEKWKAAVAFADQQAKSEAEAKKKAEAGKSEKPAEKPSTPEAPK